MKITKMVNILDENNEIILSSNKKIRKMQVYFLSRASKKLSYQSLLTIIEQNYDEIAELKNIYAISLYVIFKSVEEKKIFIDETDLREILGCTEKYLIKHNFVKKVLREPIDEINKKTDIFVEIKNIFNEKQNKVIGWIFIKYNKTTGGTSST